MLAAVLVAGLARAQSGYFVTGRGADWRVVSKTTVENGTNCIHSYTELETGMHHQRNGQWVESREWIDILPNGTAAATSGQHQAYFPGDIYKGQIELVTPDGQHLKSRPIGLSFFDGKNSVLIAELTNSIGVVVGNNQVVYQNAFTDFKADLRYTYTKAGFEQDIILRQQPPTPESFGLNPGTARLQVLTEFFAPPQPTIQTTKLPEQTGLALTDQSLGFGTMQMIPGRAFLLEQNAKEAGAKDAKALVGKQWQQLDGRQFLVEEVPVDAIADGLAALPLTAMQSGSGKNSHTASRHLALPPQRLAKNDASKPMLMAKAALPTQGFVLDYQTVNSSQTNYTFQSNTTYYISGNVLLWGTNIFEGGAVLKYTNNAYICIQAIKINAAADRPVIFTAKDDNSVGDNIGGSTGAPDGYYAADALWLTGSTSSLQNMRFAFAQTAIMGGGTVNLTNVQMANCQNGVKVSSYQSLTLNLRNVLMANVRTNVNLVGLYGGASLFAQNATFANTPDSGDENNYSLVGEGSTTSWGFNMTNCILVDMNFDNSGGHFSGSYNGFYPDYNDFGNPIGIGDLPFQSAGAGSYYLTDASGLRNAGTTNINPNLLAELRTMTTYAPQDGGYADTNTPDPGYHYPVNEDSDYDGLPDWWEWKWLGNYTQTGSGDYDGDGVSNLNEYLNGTDPTNYYNGVLPQLTIDKGNYQCGAPGSLLPIALAVKITGTNGVILTNAPLIFTAAQGGLTTSTNGTTTNSIALRTDSNGMAAVYLFLPLTTNADCFVSVTAWSGTNSVTATFKEHSQMPMISAGDDFAFYLKPNGHVLAWGREVLGGAASEYYGTSVPKEIPGLTNIVKISAGKYHALALAENGTVWAWGDNWSGELGTVASGDYQLTPVPVPGLTNVVDIAAGGYNSLVVESDGTVWGWGDIYRTGSSNSTPAQIAGITNAVQVASGFDQVLVRLADGTVKAWGYNFFGELGNGNYTDSQTPVLVTNLANIAQVAAGAHHSLAVQSNGLVWAWGANYSGELGNGQSGNKTNRPVQVIGLSNAVQVAGGRYDSFAVDSAGNIWSWGDKDNGKLGIGDYSGETYLPLQLTNAFKAAMVVAGYDFSVALASDGKLYAWGAGDGSDYELGYGTTYSSNEPDYTRPYSVYYNPVEPKPQIIQAGACANPFLAQSFQFRVTDLAGNPLTNAPVYVRVAQGDLWLDTNSDAEVIQYNEFSDLRLDTGTNGEVEVFAYAFDTVNTNCTINFYAASPEGGLGVGTNLQLTIVIPKFQITGGQYQTNAAGMFLPVTVQLTGAGSAPLTNIEEAVAIVSGAVQLATATNGIAETSLTLTTDSSGLTSFWVYFPTNVPLANFLDDMVSVQIGSGGYYTGTNFNPNIIGYPAGTYWSGLPDYLANPDGALGTWETNYFGHGGLDPLGDYDSDGTNNLQEYLNGADPNKISFAFSFANQYVSTNIVSGIITVLGGVPSYFALLVDSTNFAGATWTAYTSSNLTVSLGTNQGAHDVWVGLRGLPSNAHQTWEETTLVLDSVPPTISITNPVNNVSFNASRVNVSGNFTAGSLKQVTVNGVLAFVNGTNFNALNVPLDAGTNIITALLEDLTGSTNVASINIITTTNANGSLNNPVQLQATPIAGFAPLTVTFQVQTNMPGTFQQAAYDFNGDSLADFVTNNLNSITHAYATNGEYFPVVTIQTTTGRFSSVGGWNAVALDEINQPIRINVQMPPTVATFASITDPVDLKLIGTNLYVLSRSAATLTEFSTNGSTIRSLSSVGTNPSGFDVDAAGNVYVAVSASNQVWKLKPTSSSFAADTNFGVRGVIGFTNGISGTTNGAFNAPFDVAVTPDGQSISVSDSGNHRIQQFAVTTGAFIASFGAAGSAVGQFNAPKGLTYDSVGTLYVVDSGNNRIVLAQGSSVQGVAGTNGTALGQFSGPVNLCVGTRGVYVADTGNNRIQKFKFPASGFFSITASSIDYAVTTNLSQPYAVAAVNNFTNDLFYIADTGNNRVILCTAPSGDADPVLAVWNHMTARIAAADIPGAASDFSSLSADKYRQSFLDLGTVTTISAIGQIGTLKPVFVNGDTAEYYFQQTIDGQAITFPIEFVKENGAWKIDSF